jgi:hypothetical protein
MLFIRGNVLPHVLRDSTRKKWDMQKRVLRKTNHSPITVTKMVRLWAA